MKDVFGKVLLGYWEGDHKTPHFIRRDDGFLDETPTNHYFKTALSPSEKLILKYARGKILDVGCGAGRALLYFQKKNLEVQGIDSSPLAVQVCKERGLRAEVKDVFTMKRPNTFDSVVLFGNNIGIGGDLRGVQELLKKLYSLTKKGGHLLLTSIDVTKTKNPDHLAYHKLNLKKKKYVGEVRIRVEYKNQLSPYFKWIHIDPETLKALAQKANWKLAYLKTSRDGQYSAVLEK